MGVPESKAHERKSQYNDFTVVSLLHLYHKSILVDVDFLCFCSCLCPQKIHAIDSFGQGISKNIHLISFQEGTEVFYYEIRGRSC